MSKPTTPHANATQKNDNEPASNFLRQVIEHDIAQQTYAQRGTGAGGGLSGKEIIATRFPPEPNGYLHIGHAKSICLNFGLARDYGGVCHMRFDDTNPVKEDTEYVDTILDSVNWLGFSYGDNLFYASDYFDKLYAFAETLIEQGAAYVDSQSADEMRQNRGTLTEAGKDSPFRQRTIAENLDLFRRMKAGEFADGTHILRAKIDMASPNINLRDPAIYRIRHAHHHRTGDAWCIYPMYDYAHCVSDALENITHSICTLEFEDHRPLYDWILDKLAQADVFKQPLPHQYEFARLNLTYAITSKRKLLQLVTDGHVDGWDDPRMPTLVGIRRRGFTPESIHLFCDRIGVSKADSWIDMSVLEGALRDDLDAKATRAIAVLDPIKLIIDNYPEHHTEICHAPLHPHHPELGKRTFPFAKELWIEREDFMETPTKGYFRLFPGNRVRLRYGFVIECKYAEKDSAGNLIAVHADYFPDSKSGTPGSDNYKVKGNLHWVAVQDAYQAEVRLYDRLFTEPHPDAGGKDFLVSLNPQAKQTIVAYLEPSLRHAQPEDRFQFERHGYFVADRVDSRTNAPVFNRIVTLKDSWGK